MTAFVQIADSQGFWIIKSSEGPIIRISNKFSGDAHATIPGTTLWETLLQMICES